MPIGAGTQPPCVTVVEATRTKAPQHHAGVCGARRNCAVLLCRSDSPEGHVRRRRVARGLRIQALRGERAIDRRGPPSNAAVGKCLWAVAFRPKRWHTHRTALAFPSPAYQAPRA